MEIGIALAVAVALMTNLASLLKHRGCQDAASVSVSRPLSGLRDLASSRWFVAGWLLAGVGWLAHVAALSMAPISLVQAVLAGGAVTLAVLSQRLFGDKVERRQWLALIIGAAGLVLLVVTLPRLHGADSGFSTGGIAGFEGGLILLAVGIALSHRSERFVAHRGVLRAVLAGLLFALAGIAIKALLGGSGGLLMAIPLLITVLACGAFAQYSAVGALQAGGAVETIGLMGLVANAVQIVGGILVFGDPLSPSPLGIALQVTAFAMVCLSALLLPAAKVAPTAAAVAIPATATP
jgi:drug/metabolite transporter (DMT)-like permease